MASVQDTMPLPRQREVSCTSPVMLMADLYAPASE